MLLVCAHEDITRWTLNNPAHVRCLVHTVYLLDIAFLHLKQHHPTRCQEVRTNRGRGWGAAGAPLEIQIYIAYYNDNTQWVFNPVAVTPAQMGRRFHNFHASRARLAVLNNNAHQGQAIAANPVTAPCCPCFHILQHDPAILFAP